ncbi:MULTISPECIES: LuxR C-terminal-related transcriptional regulator [Burkholderia]|uniref:LuxR family transcriptional regulator n=1 Tax=Burkholderia paludis TaxID=1506587 RepID=A0A6P2SG13_9BURK|nr:MULTISPECIES: LuxR C-terminal-related transcriptional regulator [Burkholderia]CAB3773361.1 HTH-type transcriptional regulator MalT [Burkholderia paludis]VWC45153.1 LuxR family transcriptional regulator [Burkholderia paludis]
MEGDIGATYARPVIAPATPIVSTKLQYPIPPSAQVHRKRLLEAMCGKTAGCRLILVQAPAGFGKSTLLSQYRTRREEDGASVMWLTLDSADNDLDRFVRHLHAGLMALHPSVADESSGDTMSLIARLAGLAHPFTIFLDEFEALHNPAAIGYVRQLIECLPINGEIVIGSRHVPEIGLGRLRVRGQLLEFSHGDLRFSLEETRQLLERQPHLALTGRHVEMLHERTEGWITAIHLFALAISNYRDVGQFIKSFSGSHAELAQFLAEDILQRLADDHRDFLLRTSILGELNESLCNHVAQREDSRVQLEILSRNNLFLIPLDSQHFSYRYHGLFASFLRDRLKVTQPDLFFQLHLRAAEWLRSHGRPLLAIDHLLYDKNQREAIALLDAHAGSLLTQGRVRRLSRWYDRLSPALLRNEPALRLTFGWALVLNRRHGEAQRIIDDFLADVPASRNPEHVREARALSCLQLSMTDQIEACYPASEALLADVTPAHTLQFGVLVSIVAYCMIAAGRFDDARQTMARALQSDRQLNASFIRSLSDAQEGGIDLIQGRLGEAFARLERSYERAVSTGSNTVPGGRAVIGIPFAEVLYERNALERAQRVASEWLPYVRENGTVDAFIQAYLLLSKIAVVAGDVDSSKRYRQELEDAGLEMGLIRVVASAKLEAARILWLNHDLKGALSLLDQAEATQVWKDGAGYSAPVHDIESVDVMRWRLMIAKGEGAHAASQLKAGLRAAQSAQRHRRALKLRILLSTALMATGQTNPAMQTLTEALQIASREGFVRIFLDEGESVAALLRIWFNRHRENADRLDISATLCEQLLDTLSVAPLPSAPASADTHSSTALTKRELQVLRYLADGARTRAIADTLFVSEVTIKAHLRNINAKLGAHGRVEAVAIARRQGLL